MKGCGGAGQGVIKNFFGAHLNFGYGFLNVFTFHLNRLFSLILPMIFLFCDKFLLICMDFDSL